MKLLLVGFQEKILLGKLIFLGHFFPVWWGMIEIERGHCWSLYSQDMIRILKQSRHDFSVKHLCDGYCKDIMWCLCVEVKIQQIVIWFCKAYLRICYVSLFEFKGPWKLKIDSLIF